MKKIILLLTIFTCFSFISVEENKEITIEIEEIVSACPPNSSSISSSCFSGCVSVVPTALGNCLECDVAAFNEGPRAPTEAEYEEAQELLDAYCNS